MLDSVFIAKLYKLNISINSFKSPKNVILKLTFSEFSVFNKMLSTCVMEDILFCLSRIMIQVISNNFEYEV